MDYSNWILSNTNKTKEILNNYNNKNINKKLQKKTQFKVVKSWGSIRVFPVISNYLYQYFKQIFVSIMNVLIILRYANRKQHLKGLKITIKIILNLNTNTIGTTLQLPGEREISHQGEREPLQVLIK